MQRHAVVRVFIDSFKNVDLAALWPVGAECPESVGSYQYADISAGRMNLRWPRAAPKRHVFQIEDNKPTIILLLAFYPNTGSAPWCLVRNINTKVCCCSGGCVDEV
jgi:hypothetical protein